MKKLGRQINCGDGANLIATVRKAVFKMKKVQILAMAALAAIMAPVAQADDEDYYDDDRQYWYRSGNSPEIDVWVNKGDGAHYYYGEDVAVFFRADDDCYVVVYDVDPSGEVNILFPGSFNGSSYVRGGEIYRVPDYGDDFRLEVAGQSGTEHIFAVASYSYMNPPDFMRYIGYDYGDGSYYDDDYFVVKVRGNLDGFVTNINARICSGPYTVAHTRFFADTHYRHHRHYRYWDHDPYYVSSIWVGCDVPGAEIWIDGVYFGIAPILIPRVVVGYHWIWAYYGGYPCYQRYFYAPHYQRYYIDIRFDYRYKDYRYRRHAFRGWVFEEKKYRNEDGFKERAREYRQKSIRTRSLPPSVVRDYTDRGLLSKDAPIVKKVRSGDSGREIRSSGRTRDTRPDGPGSIERGKEPRTRTSEPNRREREGKIEESNRTGDSPNRINDRGAVEREKNRGNESSRGAKARDDSEKRTGGRDNPDRGVDEGNVIKPERKQGAERSRPADIRDDSERKSTPQKAIEPQGSKARDRSIERRQSEERRKSEMRESRSDENERAKAQVKERRQNDDRKESKKESSKIDKVEKKNSDGDSGKRASVKSAEKKQSRSTNRSSRTQERKERNR